MHGARLPKLHAIPRSHTFFGTALATTLSTAPTLSFALVTTALATALSTAPERHLHVPGDALSYILYEYLLATHDAE